MDPIEPMKAFLTTHARMDFSEGEETTPGGPSKRWRNRKLDFGATLFLVAMIGVAGVVWLIARHP